MEFGKTPNTKKLEPNSAVPQAAGVGVFPWEWLASKVESDLH